MKVALVYDRVNKWGGAERVLLALHDLFPDAPLYTSVYNPKTAPWANVFDVRISFLQQFPYASTNHEWYAFLIPLVFESFSFDEYDLVISVTSEAAKGIVTKPGTAHLCYCLTPTRYLWSAYEKYFKNKIFRILTTPVVSYLRAWDKIASQRPDAYIAISKEVQNRIKKYYGRESNVVYPPIMLSQMSNVKCQMSNVKPYFLVVSRFVPYKRIDIAIEACNELGLSLKIIGTGSEEKHLRSLAGSTIEFLGNLTDGELVGYYKDCEALIFPGIEDFGLSMAEAASLGKPIIAYKAGGALEIVQEGKTGAFFYPQTISGLQEVLMRFDRSLYMPDDCKKRAELFTLARFTSQFLPEVKKFTSKLI